MKKIFCIALAFLAFAALSLLAACSQKGCPEGDTAVEEIQNPLDGGQESETPGTSRNGCVDIKIIQVPHCEMKILSQKEQYKGADTIEFRYELDDGYAIDYITIEIETIEGEIYEEKRGGACLSCFLPEDWKSAVYTPAITDKVQSMPEIRIENKYGGSGTAEWMFDCVAEGQTENYIILEPDENSYISDVGTYGLYYEPVMEGNVPMGGYKIMHSYRYDAYGVYLVALELPGPPADEVYIGVTFIAKEHASVLRFACKNDFERAEPLGDRSAALSTVTVVADNGEPYHFNFRHEGNYNAIVANGYEFIGWADEAGEIVCETLDGVFDASRDATFYITFRDVYE